MLFIYSALPLGGIETFFVRMAKERFRKNQKTKLLLTSAKEFCDQGLLSEIRQYAEVYFVDDVYYLPNWFSRRFLLLAPLRRDRISHLLAGIEHIHVTNGFGGMLAERLLSLIKVKIKITVGFYHSLEYSWGAGTKLPYFERVNRRFVFDFLPKSNLFVFAQTTIEFYKNRLNKDLSGAPVFRIGVIERCEHPNKKARFNSGCVQICSVGRLADFKTYNMWMLDVVNDLIKLGYQVRYDIYGDGSERDRINQKIKDFSLDDNVFLMGSLKYESFNEIVKNYDLFVGSGTAIIQASSLGVPSIIGIESIQSPLTYGYFKDFNHVDYNISSLPFKKIFVLDVIKEFIALSDEYKKILSDEHFDSIENFYMDACNKNFNNHGEFISDKFFYSTLLYEISWKLTALHSRINKNSIYRNKYVEKVVQ